MIRIILNISKNYRQCLFVFAAMVLVLLTSCPVKIGIKNLAGIPAKTEQNTGGKKIHLFGNNQEKCVNSEAADAEIFQSPLVHTDNILPAVLFTAAFIFLLGYRPGRQQTHPLYGNVKIPATLPLFLRHRKLLI